MTDHDPKSELLRYFQAAHDALRWKLDGLSEYDVRRPMTPTGTNLLGLLKHAACVEYGYFGDTFARPYDEAMPWLDDPDADPNADMYATREQSREDILGLYDRAGSFAVATVDALPLDAVGRVPWWPAERAEVSLHRALVHLIAEINRHGGHADIVRELIDGAAGLRADNDNLPPYDASAWADYRQQLQTIADSFRE